jgi:hypothetical protein
MTPSTLTPQAFVDNWQHAALKERSACQEHFIAGGGSGFSAGGGREGDREGAEKRTLTSLYHQRPAWLDNAHRKLDEAVSAAYGWPVDLSDDEILAHLLELYLKRAGK